MICPAGLCQCFGSKSGRRSTKSIQSGKRFAPAAVLLLLIGCSPAPPPSGAAPSPRPPAAFTKPLSFAILEDYDKNTPLAEVARDFSLFKELGVPVWRGSFGWDDYEPERGKYDFTWLRAFARLADSMGISLRPYIGYTPAWAARGGKDEHAWNDAPKNLDDWARFVGALATALRADSSVRSYEIYNEENVPLWWDGTAAEYAQVLHRGADAVRRSDPDAAVLLGGMVWPDVEWLETACDGGRAPFDVLPFHAYPETWTPDSVRVENYLGQGFGRGFLPAADARCGRKPIWINETGFATTPGKTERAQAEWWARAFATFLSAPRVEHLGIYEIRDQRQDTPVIGDAPNYYLGLLRQDRTPKLAFRTVKLLLHLFRGDSITVADRELTARVVQGKSGELHHHLFVRSDGTQVAFVWERIAAPVVELRFRRSGRITSYDLEGRATALPGNSAVIRQLQLTPGEVRIFEVAP